MDPQTPGFSRSREPDLLVAAVRRLVPMTALPGFFDSAYRGVVDALAHPDVRGAGPSAPTGPAIAWYHSMADGVCDVPAALPVEPTVPVGPLHDAHADDGRGDVATVVIPGGPALSLWFTGGYDGLPAAWQSFMGAAQAAGAELRGDCTEEYVTGPLDDPDPAQWRTRLVLPVL